MTVCAFCPRSMRQYGPKSGRPLCKGHLRMEVQGRPMDTPIRRQGRLRSPSVYAITVEAKPQRWVSRKVQISSEVEDFIRRRADAGSTTVEAILRHVVERWHSEMTRGILRREEEDNRADAWRSTGFDMRAP